jgi:hypothetical protein
MKTESHAYHHVPIYSLIAALIALLCGPAPAHAGAERGNGGVSLVCWNTDQSLRSVETLDLYRARSEWNLQLPDAGINTDELLHSMAERLAPYGQLRFYFERALKDAQAELDTTLSPEGVPLFSTDDEGPRPVAPAGCSFEQLAVYVVVGPGTNGKLLTRPDYYREIQRDSRQSAVFFAHEALYRLASTYAGYRDSIGVQELVANLIAKNGDQKRIDAIARSISSKLPYIYFRPQDCEKVVNYPEAIEVSTSAEPVVVSFGVQGKNAASSLRLGKPFWNLAETIGPAICRGRGRKQVCGPHQVQIPLAPSVLRGKTLELISADFLGTHHFLRITQGDRILLDWSNSMCREKWDAANISVEFR